jgi:hypothetical protein
MRAGKTAGKKSLSLLDCWGRRFASANLLPHPFERIGRKLTIELFHVGGLNVLLSRAF